MNVASFCSVTAATLRSTTREEGKERGMKPLIVIGLILVLLGGLVLAYQGFTYITHEKVIDAGPVQVTAEKQNFVYLPPILGAVTLGAGVLLMVIGATRRGTA
jgi:hypothetical protein